MKFIYSDFKISGILSILPKKEISFEDEISNYKASEGNSRKLKKLLGFDKRRIVEEGTTCSDLAVYGIKHLLSNEVLLKEDIGCILFVSVTPDYLSPPTSNVIHGQLDLSDDVVCLDINQGCAGFIVGVFNGFNLLNAGMSKKVILINADISSHIVSPKDRNTAPIFGDAATITVIEKSNDKNNVQIDIKNRGKDFDAIIIPAGGVRIKSSIESLRVTEDNDGNLRTLHHSHMKGDLVYNFTTNDVVNTINETIIDNPIFKKDKIDYYVFHQPNKFILNRMVDKLGLDHNLVPNNIVENFGNSNGSSIPLCLTYNFSEQLKIGYLNLFLSGFGVGLSWNTLLMRLGELNFCDIIEY
jgi:3-oxoacyl-[acyl-carrier-protein] synthase-3